MIKINDLKIFGYHGLYEIEKKEGQIFLLNISYTYIDDGVYIVDYIKFTKFLLRNFNNQRHDYLEDLVDRLIKDMHFNFPYIKYMKISIYKEKLNTRALDLELDFKGVRNIGIEVEKSFS